MGNVPSEQSQWPHHFSMMGELLVGFIFLIVAYFLYMAGIRERSRGSARRPRFHAPAPEPSPLSPPSPPASPAPESTPPRSRPRSPPPPPPPDKQALRRSADQLHPRARPARSEQTRGVGVSHPSLRLSLIVERGSELLSYGRLVASTLHP